MMCPPKTGHICELRITLRALRSNLNYELGKTDVLLIFGTRNVKLSFVAKV